MTIYIDNDYKCHIEPAEGLRAVEISGFNGKCAAYIEGLRYVPVDETWTREDGEVFVGEMISPWKDYAELEKAQLEYEIEQLKKQNAEYESALTEIEIALGVNS